MAGSKLSKKSKKTTNKEVKEESITPSVIINDIISSLETEYKKQHKENIVINKATDLKIKQYKTGYLLLDMILNGGIRKGSLAAVVGKPSAGKTTLSLNIISNLMKNNDKVICVYFDAEHMISAERLMDLGIDPQKCIIPFGPVRNEEQQLNGPTKQLDLVRMNKFIQTCVTTKINYPDVDFVFVWDSVPLTVFDEVVERNLDKKADNMMGAKRAKDLGETMKNWVSLFDEYGFTLFAINQFRTKINTGYIPTRPDMKHLKNYDKKIPGGAAFDHAINQYLELTDIGALDRDAYAGKKKAANDVLASGRIINVNLVKSKTSRAGLEVELILTGKGFNNFWSNLHFLISEKYVIPSGSHRKIKNSEGEEFSFTLKDVENKYETDKEFKDALDYNLEEAVRNYCVKFGLNFEKLGKITMK